NPAFAASYSGFVSGETLATSGVTGSPSLTTSATSTSTPGSYTITAALGTLAASNYAFAFVNGTLTVNNSPPSVTSAASQTAVPGVSQSFDLGSFNDPGVNNNPWSVTVSWCDATGNTSFNMSSQGALTRKAHTYAGAGVYNVTVTVTG